MGAGPAPGFRFNVSWIWDEIETIHNEGGEWGSGTRGHSRVGDIASDMV